MSKIMMVDDEENILNGYRRSLRGYYSIHLFDDPFKALVSLQDLPDYSVILSDYNMPVMKGLEFLKKTHEICPNSVKVLLTGYADLQLVINAINEGYIYRFLTKPCSTEDLINTLNQSINQHKLIIAEKELIEKTLKGSIKILIDILSVASPILFNRASTMRDFAKKMLNRLSITDSWEIEIAILLSQIGCVGIPPEVVEKRLKGIELTHQEEEIYHSHAEIGYSLLKNIPRLEKIAHAIALQFKTSETIEKEDNLFIESNVIFIAKLLRIMNDYFWLIERGLTPKRAVACLHEEASRYDSMLLSALDAEVLGVSEGYVVVNRTLEQLREGMVLADNFLDQNRYMLLPKGTVLSEIYIIKLQNVAKIKNLTPVVKVYSKL